MLLLSSRFLSLNQGDVLRRKYLAHTQYYKMVHLVYFFEVPIRKVTTFKKREELITTDWILGLKTLQGLWRWLCGSECLLFKHGVLSQIPSTCKSWVWLSMCPLKPQCYAGQRQEDHCSLLVACPIPSQMTSWLKEAKWRLARQNVLCLPPNSTRVAFHYNCTRV